MTALGYLPLPVRYCFLNLGYIKLLNPYRTVSMKHPLLGIFQSRLCAAKRFSVPLSSVGVNIPFKFFLEFPEGGCD
jgi:hypothetical protein